MLVLGFYGFQVKKLLPEFRFRKGGSKEQFLFFDGVFKDQMEGM